jgi:hypothetical protein
LFCLLSSTFQIKQRFHLVCKFPKTEIKTVIASEMKQSCLFTKRFPLPHLMLAMTGKSRH